MATRRPFSFWIEWSGFRLTLNTHLDFITRRLTGQGTRFHVSIPVNDANSLSAALSQHILSGDFSSCFQVLGASVASWEVLVAPLAQFPSLSGTFLKRGKRGVEVEGVERDGDALEQGSRGVERGLGKGPDSGGLRVEWLAGRETSTNAGGRTSSEIGWVATTGITFDGTDGRASGSQFGLGSSMKTVSLPGKTEGVIFL
jgi:hypothetical protein